jgi:hypothetical protein
VEPRWKVMATKLPPLVEENVNTLMNVADEEVWKAEGLFDQVDSAVYVLSH